MGHAVSERGTRMLRGLAFWSLLPFVSLQALRVRKSALRLPPASGPCAGSIGSGAAFRLLAIGDSIIAGVGATSMDKALVGRTAEALAGALGRTVEWHSIGRSGIDSGGVIMQLLGDLPPAPVDAFLVSVGVNDVTSLRRSSTWEHNVASLLLALTDHSPGAVIVFAGMPPLHGFPLLPQPLRALIGFRGETFDRISRTTIAAHPQARHVPVEFPSHADRFSADGFHPSEASYVDFGRTMASSILAMLPSKRQKSARVLADSGPMLGALR